MTELWRRSATELAATIASGEASSVEVVRSHLDRIDAVDDWVNAITVVLTDEALAAAGRADAAVAAGEELGPLHGVPFTSKENLDHLGTATTQGVVAFADAMPSLESPVIERMKKAGAIPIARTNMPDVGLRMHTDSGLWGLTRNPWNPDVTAGGSSGGEAAALAAGMSPIGLGNDIGGSLRNPAFCCGVASLKPGRGRIPRAPSIEPRSPSLAGQLMSVNGPMARSVTDLKVALEVLAGAHVRDPLSLPLPVSWPANGRAWRVAMCPAPDGGSTHPAIEASVRLAGDILADAGCEVIEVSPPRLEEAYDTWGRWLIGEVRVPWPLLEMVVSPDAARFLELSLEEVPAPTHEEAVGTQVLRHQLEREWAEFFGSYDVILGPVWTDLPFAHGADIADEDSHRAVMEQVRFVTPFNLLGLPAAVVPIDIAEGMPMSVQIGGPQHHEERCLTVAQIIEDARGPLTPIDPVM